MECGFESASALLHCCVVRIRQISFLTSVEAEDVSVRIQLDFSVLSGFAIEQPGVEDFKIVELIPRWSCKATFLNSLDHFSSLHVGVVSFW